MPFSRLSISGSESTTRASRFVATAVDHPRLMKIDVASIHTLLRDYDHYVNEVNERLKQLTGQDFMTAETVAAVSLR